jgi:hypothetical protein
MQRPKKRSADKRRRRRIHVLVKIFFLSEGSNARRDIHTLNGLLNVSNEITGVNCRQALVNAK